MNRQLRENVLTLLMKWRQTTANALVYQRGMFAKGECLEQVMDLLPVYEARLREIDAVLIPLMKEPGEN